MFDLKLDELYHDLEMKNFDFVLISDADALAQKIKIRLLWIYKEWFLDESIGIDVFNDVITKNPDLGFIRSLYQNEILSIKGVLEILNFTVDLNKAERKLYMSMDITTVFGDVTIKDFGL